MTKTPRISILGDSISTFPGYNPEGFSVYYRDYYSHKNEVITPDDTWWMQVITALKCGLCVNNSYSGSRVTGSAFPSGNSLLRTQGLHAEGTYPALILVYIGMNDFGYAVPLGKYRGIGPIPKDVSVFRNAYATMLSRLRENYSENIEIYCGTLCKTYVPDDDDWSFPQYNHALIAFKEYNKAIRELAPAFKCKTADIASLGTPYEALDGTHPNKRGMKTLSQLWLHCLSV